MPIFGVGRVARGAGILTIGIGLPLVFAEQAAARITGLTYTTSQPFGTTSLGNAGPYQQLDGTATGELDPYDPLNAIITDIDLAPKQNGKVQYSLTFSILMPTDLSKSNHTLLYDVVNRGNKVITGWNNVIPNAPATGQGDGFLENNGFILVWSGWESDLLTAPGRIQLTPVVAAEYGGRPISGRVVYEYDLSTAASIIPLGSGPMVGNNGAAYPPLNPNSNAGATLTERVHQSDPKTPIANSQWQFTPCTQAQFPTVVGIAGQTCVQMINGQFDTNHIYELTYTATNPTVSGIGLAAMRDFISFLHHGDPTGKVANPLKGGVQNVLMHGTSQSGRMARTFLSLGFNEDEEHRRVVDGMNPHIGSFRIEINTRFAQTSRGPGLQHEEKLSTANSDAPVSYGDKLDPVEEIDGGLLDRCRRTDTCPKIIHTNSDVEYWQGGMSLDTTDFRYRDLPIPENVRIFHFAGTQHSGFSPVTALPTTTGICEYLPNVNVYVYQQRALLIALNDWVSKDKTPPDSLYARISDDTLRQPAAVGYPNLRFSTGISAYPKVAFNGLYNTRNVLFWGPLFEPKLESGIKTAPPLVEGASYSILEPRVNSDGNDIDGLHSAYLDAPIGTHMGWNYRAANFGEGDLCDLTGSYIPFPVTKAQRMSENDPRPSLQERYTNQAGYVAAFTAAANALVAKRLMLQSDVAGAVANATAWFAQASGGQLP